MASPARWASSTVTSGRASSVRQRSLSTWTWAVWSSSAAISATIAATSSASAGVAGRTTTSAADALLDWAGMGTSWWAAGQGGDGEREPGRSGGEPRAARAGTGEPAAPAGPAQAGGAQKVLLVGTDQVLVDGGHDGTTSFRSGRGGAGGGGA